jgi:hypothetical protein
VGGTVRVLTEAEIARELVQHTVQVLTDTSHPQAVLARVTAERAAFLGRAYTLTPCEPVSRMLTKEQCEQAIKENEEQEKRYEKQRAEASRRGPVLDTPEVWANRKPRLITAAGEKKIT